MGGRLVAAGYFGLQAVCGIVLWVLIAVSPTVRSGFDLVEGRRVVTDAYFFADLVAVGGSALAAWAAWRDRPWAVVAAAVTLGAVVYPTVYLIAWVAIDGTAAAALGVMVPVTVLTAWATRQLWVARTEPVVGTGG